MANRRKTVSELKAAGTYRPSRHGARDRAESTPGVSFLAPSYALPADVQTERNRLCGLHGDRLTTLDGTLLDELAERVVEVRRLRAAGRLQVPGTMEYTRVSSAMTAALAALDRLATAFGMTPASRAALPDLPKDSGTAPSRPKVL